MENKKTEYNKINKKKNTVEEKINKLNETTVETNIAAEQPKKPAKVKAKVLANGASLNLREEPSCTAKVITIMPPGSSVTILEDDDRDFYKVSWNEFTGYAMKKFIVK